MSSEILFISGFLIFIVLILALDLGLFSKKDHVVSLKQAGVMSFIMVMLALGFYFLLILSGQQLHGITDYAKLEQIVKSHQHAITLIPGNFEESLKTVSYTHLDVYKRQPIGCKILHWCNGVYAMIC